MEKRIILSYLFLLFLSFCLMESWCVSGSLPGLSRTLKTFSSLSSTPLVCKWRRKCVSDARVLCRFTHASVCVCFWCVGCHFSCIGVRLGNIEASRHSARNWKSISLKVRRGNERVESKWKKEERQRLRRWEEMGEEGTGDQKIMVRGGERESSGYRGRKAGNRKWSRYYFKRWTVTRRRRRWRWGKDKTAASLPS